MTRNSYDRFIPGEEIQAIEPWRFGAIDTAAQLRAAKLKAQAEQEQQAQEQAALEQSFQQGFTQGIAQGRIQAQADMNRQMQEFLQNQARQAGERQAALFATAQDELLQAEQAMAQEVLALACAMARQVLQQELSVNPNVVLPVLREALALLGADCKTAVVKMHPADIQALGDQIVSAFTGLSLSLRPDATLQPGGCQVESAGKVVDGSMGKRWQRAVASLGLSSTWEASGEPG